METVELLQEEIGLLVDLSKDTSFDAVVLEDAKALVEIKNKSIIDMGGTPVVVTVQEQVGITKEDVRDTLLRMLKATYLSKDRVPKIMQKYKQNNKMFKLKFGITYEEYKERGEKFFYGGVVSNYTNNVLSNLAKTNQFVLLRETQSDAVLKHTTPEKSFLYQVLLSKEGNFAYALAYPLGKNTVVDFYQDEELIQSLNYTFTFTPSFNEDVFSKEFSEMMVGLSDVEKKYYSNL